MHDPQPPPARDAARLPADLGTALDARPRYAFAPAVLAQFQAWLSRAMPMGLALPPRDGPGGLAGVRP